MTIANIGLLGFGEVGQTLADDLAAIGKFKLSVWDIQFKNTASAPTKALSGRRVYPGKSNQDAFIESDLIISAVTASQTLKAAQNVAASLKKDVWYVDMNSSSPAMKTEAAELVNSAGGRYVEAAVMSPISTKRISTAILLGGKYAKEFEIPAHNIGFTGVKYFDDDYGKTSAAKMCRSVMIKGMETLLTESLLSARYYGVDDTVVSSLSDLFPGPDWQILSLYMISRSLEHGTRRAEEMREVALTVSQAGLQPSMSDACAKRQDWAAQHSEFSKITKLQPMLDAILKAIK